jgi:hypothetical protein
MAQKGCRMAEGLWSRRTVRDICGGKCPIHGARRSDMPCALAQDERSASHSETAKAACGSSERQVLMLAEDRLRRHLCQ